MRYSTLTQNESEQRNALSDKIHSIEFPSLLTCLLLSSSTTIIKKDQKLRKNNGVNNTRKNLTFLTVLGLSKKNREKGKRNQRRKTKTLHHTPWILPLYYPPMNMHVFNCFSFNFIWGIEQCGNWIFALYPNFEFYYCVNRSLQEINAQFLFVNQKFLPGYRQIEFWIFFGG